MSSALQEARLGLRLRRRRSLLTALGVALAAAMLAAAVVVADSLGTGFDRAAGAAGLPDITVRFDPQPAQRIARRISTLPDVAGFSLRQEVTGLDLAAGEQSSDNGAAEMVGPGRRGYAVVDGRDLSSRPGDVVVEAGLAAAWRLRVGGTVEVGGLGPQRIVGFAESPDNVSYPLAVPRVYLSRAAVDSAVAGQFDPRINTAQIWLRDRRNLDEVLVQARAISYGLHGLRVITRSGVRVVLDQAAGIVIDLLVALSLIALGTAALLLGASARAEVQRRLGAIGVRRALGASRAHLTASQALEAVLVAGPAATVGLLAGTLATYGPTSRLLTMLNEPPAGMALAGPLLGAWMASVAIPAAAAAWPAWRAAGRPPVDLLRGAELRRPRRRHAALSFAGGGAAMLGARLVGARRIRLIATATGLGISTAFVLLMLALASALSALETDPGALGKRYQLTADLPPSAVKRVQAIRGVQAAAPRYELQAADSFALDETIDVIAYPGNHTIFEGPPLTSGSRLKRPDEVEVGAGLANALGLSPGSTLALQLPSGTELRLRVTGVVSSLQHDGRVAYLPAPTLLRAEPDASAELAVRVRPGASVSAVTDALGPYATSAAGATARGAPLVQTLRSIIRAVAIVDGLVCVYALIQACALTVQERRRTVSVLRAAGAGPAAVRRLLAGAVVAMVLPAVALGIVVERLVLGPAMSQLAAAYAALPLGARLAEIAAVVGGLLLAGVLAVVWVGRQTTRETVIAGLGAR